MEPIITSLLSSAKILLVSLTAAVVAGSPVSASFNTSIPVNAGTSRNWSGYVASSGSFTAVSGSWVVPTVAGGSNFSADATWVGIGGVASKDLIQGGTQATIGRNGQVYYQAWLETLPHAQQILSFRVSAGDLVAVSLTQQSPSSWQFDFKDNTSGQNYQTQVSYNSMLSSAEWIEEAPSMGQRFAPLDNFGQVQFSNATTIKDGQQMTISQAGGRPINMGQAGQVLASASGLGLDGASFNINRSNLAATSQVISNPRNFSQSPGYRFRFRSFPRGRFF